MAKEGSTVGGLMDSFGTATSIALQYGVPLEVLVNKFSHTRFEPMGHTTNPDIRIAKSLIDYIFRWLGLTFLDSYREEHKMKSEMASSTTVALTSTKTPVNGNGAEAPPTAASYTKARFVDSTACRSEETARKVLRRVRRWRVVTRSSLVFKGMHPAAIIAGRSPCEQEIATCATTAVTALVAAKGVGSAANR